MPAFAVHIRVTGPLRDIADGKRFDGAYSQRVVFAADAQTAARRAVEGLQTEPQFTQLRLVEGIGAPTTEVDEVRQTSWFEGLFNNGALIMYRGSPRSGR